MSSNSSFIIWITYQEGKDNWVTRVMTISLGKGHKNKEPSSGIPYDTIGVRNAISVTGFNYKANPTNWSTRFKSTWTTDYRNNLASSYATGDIAIIWQNFSSKDVN